jgi:hypothetical protein
MEVEEELEDDREAQDNDTAAQDVGDISWNQEGTESDSDSKFITSEVIVSEDEEEPTQSQLTITMTDSEVPAKKAIVSPVSHRIYKPMS